MISYNSTLEILNMEENKSNNTNIIERELLPDEITLFGQQLVFYGYTCLWIVAYNRLKEKSFRHENTEEEYLLPAYEEIANAYLLSVIANGL